MAVLYIISEMDSGELFPISPLRVYKNKARALELFDFLANELLPERLKEEGAQVLEVQEDTNEKSLTKYRGFIYRCITYKTADEQKQKGWRLDRVKYFPNATPASSADNQT